jgi:hypothetical protein
MPSTSEAVVEKLPSPAELKEDVVVATKKSLQSLRDFGTSVRSGQGAHADGREGRLHGCYGCREEDHCERGHGKGEFWI